MGGDFETREDAYLVRTQIIIIDNKLVKEKKEKSRYDERSSKWKVVCGKPASAV